MQLAAVLERQPLRLEGQLEVATTMDSLQFHQSARFKAPQGGLATATLVAVEAGLEVVVVMPLRLWEGLEVWVVSQWLMA